MGEENSAMETDTPQELNDSDVSSNSSDETDQEQVYKFVVLFSIIRLI